MREKHFPQGDAVEPKYRKKIEGFILPPERNAKLRHIVVNPAFR
jgi:hypothetical protein